MHPVPETITSEAEKVILVFAWSTQYRKPWRMKQEKWFLSLHEAPSTGNHDEWSRKSPSAFRMKQSIPVSTDASLSQAGGDDLSNLLPASWQMVWNWKLGDDCLESVGWIKLSSLIDLVVGSGQSINRHIVVECSSELRKWDCGGAVFPDHKQYRKRFFFCNQEKTKKKDRDAKMLQRSAWRVTRDAAELQYDDDEMQNNTML
jgi:hypothetical protein